MANQNAMAVLSRFLGMYEIKNSRSWRTEDINHRVDEIQHRNDLIKRRLEWRREDQERSRRIHKLANERRLVDSRVWQLNAISNAAVLVTLFGRQAYVESHFNSNTNAALVFIQGTTSVVSIVCTMLCVLRCVLLTLSTLKFATNDLEQKVHDLSIDRLDIESPFNDWWHARGHLYFLWSYHLFRAGVGLLVISVTLVNCALYKWTWYSVGSLSFLTILVWQWRIEGPWRHVLAYSLREDKPTS
ncbi:hypothetical protein LEN26_019421 [Aphanomyces euteiches]|nr:hypothetical protein LEN26_019421 [Aphanomyces euteiches]KAH9125675.1 hypothetical protein AeMF1_003735 [Aphanomyces euteiches]KAH9186471.1 hypothetical protein AeNC1_011550 [Aphanomyces euteiches]